MRINSIFFSIYRHTCELDWNQQWTNAVVALGALVALILHSQQTESTYRLDFIWKLQATGTLLLIKARVLFSKNLYFAQSGINF